MKNESLKQGFEITNFDTFADVYCINSCTVTNLSQRKTRQMIAHARKLNPDAVIAVIGCGTYEQNDSLNADIILGNREKLNFVSFLKDYIKNNEKIKQAVQPQLKVNKQLTYNKMEYLNKVYDVRQAIKIEDGCDNFCSYCIIPYTRGRVVSKPYSVIAEEAKQISINGAYEIVLVGIEIASYGKDLGDISLIECIEKLNDIEQVKQIRLSSLEPRFFTSGNMLRLKKCQKLCPHFHISMQSGVDKVLKEMNRKYTVNDLTKVCDDLHATFSNVYIASDVIVGFPGETDEDFNTTIETIKRCGINELHVFKYSKRVGTKAYNILNQVDGNVKGERSKRLLELSDTLKNEYMSKYINKSINILFESYEDGYLTGISKDYVKIKVKGEEGLCGMTRDVVVTSLKKGILQGKLG